MGVYLLHLKYRCVFKPQKLPRRTFKYCLLLIFLNWLPRSLPAQQLTGIWSGKISRSTAQYSGVENMEIQLFQSGKRLWGHSFSFKDTSRFVLFRVQGNRDRKVKSVLLKENGVAFYLLPPGYFPCEKYFDLIYSKIGRTEYLTGKWGGVGIGLDTSCFPNEQLIVVLQKLKAPEYPLETFASRKVMDYFVTRKNLKSEPDPVDSLLLVEKSPLQRLPDGDSIIKERKLDIQRILQLTDSVVRVSLYDNAIIDDDTISVFVNKKAYLVNTRVSDKKIGFELKLTDPTQPIEILMQAENLGSIPPNTALMIIECGKKRYEVRLTSSYEKHAVIVITYDPAGY